MHPDIDSHMHADIDSHGWVSSVDGKTCQSLVLERGRRPLHTSLLSKTMLMLSLLASDLEGGILPASAPAPSPGKSAAMEGSLPVRAVSMANQSTEMAPHPQLLNECVSAIARTRIEEMR
jgi:hypothetical protein